MNKELCRSAPRALLWKSNGVCFTGRTSHTQRLIQLLQLLEPPALIFARICMISGGKKNKYKNVAIILSWFGGLCVINYISKYNYSNRLEGWEEAITWGIKNEGLSHVPLPGSEDEGAGRNQISSPGKVFSDAQLLLEAGRCPRFPHCSAIPGHRC